MIRSGGVTRAGGFLRFGTIVLLAAACGPKPPAAAVATNPAPVPRTVRVAAAEILAWPLVLRATGETAADLDATLAAEVAGRVEEIAVDLGSLVKKGDVVARIDARELELRVAQAEAALAAARTLLGLPADGDESGFDPKTTPAVRSAQTELDDARREVDRLTSLSSAGVASQAAVDTAQARLATAEAELADAHQATANRLAIVAQRRADLALARQALTDTVIVAPFDGAIAARIASAGDHLAAGDPIARLVRVDPLRVRVEVPERDAARVRTGQPARVEITGRPEPASGTVTRTAPALADSARTLWVEIEISNEDHALRPGSFAAAEITTDAQHTALSVPREALVSFVGVEKVFVVDGTTAREKRVQVGRRDGARVEIASGLDAGAHVVLSPGNLRGGDAVRIAP